jgi:hypothetical protein
MYENQLDILEIPVRNPLGQRRSKNYLFLNSIDTGKIVLFIEFTSNQKKLNSADKLRGLLFVDAENFELQKSISPYFTES